VAEENEQPIIIKKIRRGHGGHHGGAWKVAFADFMTAMMAFFLVMWLVGQKDEVREAVAGYFRDPGQFSQQGKSGVFKGSSSVIPADNPPMSISKKDTGGEPGEGKKREIRIDPGCQENSRRTGKTTGL